MELNPVLKRFAQRVPLPVMARAVVERCPNAQDPDAWFERVAQAQYTKTLLFSGVYELMPQIVLRQSGSVRAAGLASEGKADDGPCRTGCPALRPFAKRQQLLTVPRPYPSAPRSSLPGL